MGAHPEAPSRIRLTNGSALSLGELIEGQPEKTLGVSTMHKTSRLPFLFKALSAASPLSIQLHPGKRTAQEGFEREEGLGIPRDSPLRTYRDANHKPELALALSPFKALCGFRAPREAAELFGPTLSSMLGLKNEAGEEELVKMLARLLRLEGEEKNSLLREAGARALLLSGSGDGAAGEAGATALRLSRLHPGDPGALAPLFMNLLLLKPGQGLYIPPGLMHSYLEGTILEVMASSDNVVRGGLSPKHIDVDELLRVVDPAARFGLLDTSSPGARPGIETWPCPVEDFALERIRLDSKTPPLMPIDGPEILLCIEGSATLTAPGAGLANLSMKMERKELQLRRGGSAFLGASCGSCAIKGRGTLYRVRYPGAAGRPRETARRGR
jgi:mannose-6-phosphate isomerase